SLSASAMATSLRPFVVSDRSSPGARRSSIATSTGRSWRTVGSPPVSRMPVTPRPRAMRANRVISSYVRRSSLGSHGMPSAGMQQRPEPLPARVAAEVPQAPAPVRLEVLEPCGAGRGTAQVEPTHAAVRHLAAQGEHHVLVRLERRERLVVVRLPELKRVVLHEVDVRCHREAVMGAIEPADTRIAEREVGKHLKEPRAVAHLLAVAARGRGDEI